jgi:acyl carrier protein
MGDIGIISENESYWENKNFLKDLAALKETEYLALLEYYCNPSILSPKDSLPIIGLVPHARLQEQGIEIPYWLQRPIFNHLAQIGLTSTSQGSLSNLEAVDFTTELRDAPSSEEAKDVILQAIVSKLSKALAVPTSDINSTRPLHTYGVDSLLAVELRNWFGKELRSDVAVFDIMGAESITTMSELVALRSTIVKQKEDS